MGLLASDGSIQIGGLGGKRREEPYYDKALHSFTRECRDNNTQHIYFQGLCDNAAFESAIRCPDPTAEKIRLVRC